MSSRIRGPEMRVAINRAADRARCAGPRFDTRDAVVDRPADKPVDGDAGVCADVAVVERPTSPPCIRITSPRTPASATSTFEPPPSTVTGSAGVARKRERASDLLGVREGQEPVRRRHPP